MIRAISWTRKILLVEDNKFEQAIRPVLSSAEYGAIVTEAINGQDAVDLMNKEQFDIVLMDIQMPVMDGIQATQIIRKEISSYCSHYGINSECDKRKDTGIP